jgi:hypothetical protein
MSAHVQRDQQNFMQRMTLGILRPRIFQILEQLRKILRGTASLCIGAAP